MSDKELVKELAVLNRAIYDAITAAEAFASKHGLDFINPAGEYAEYVELDEYDAETLGMVKGDFAWVSSSTFC